MDVVCNVSSFLTMTGIVRAFNCFFFVGISFLLHHGLAAAVMARLMRVGEARGGGEMSGEREV